MKHTMDTSAPQLFSFLSENVPSWISSLKSVSKAASYGQVNGTAGTSSFETLNSQTEIIHLGDGDLQKILLVPYDHVGGLTRQSSSTDNRRRSPPSVGSDGAPVDRDSYRARNAIVVSYDSEAQNRLLEVVSGISKAKDIIRRVNTSKLNKTQLLGRKVPEMTHTDSDDNVNDEDDDELDEEMVLAQIRMRRHGTRAVNQEPDSEDEEAAEQRHALDRIRQKLDLVQDLCADSAFQLLRDGNCVAETFGAVDALEAVLNIAKTAISASRAEEILESLRNSARSRISGEPLSTQQFLHSHDRKHSHLSTSLVYGIDDDANLQERWPFELPVIK